VDRDELSRELTAMAGAGFGGVEVAYVYPLGPATTDFMSDAFLADLRFAADWVHELDLRFDLTLGSGWSFGGPHITDELAARQLHWERRELTPGPLEVPVVSPWPGDQLFAAYVGAGSIQERPESNHQLPVVDGLIKIPDGDGTRQVLLAYARRTGQNVKRAAVIVRNTAANALATDQHIIELVAQSEARYGRRLQMQDLDRVMASVRSGLLSVPTIVLSSSGAQN